MSQAEVRRTVSVAIHLPESTHRLPFPHKRRGLQYYQPREVNATALWSEEDLVWKVKVHVSGPHYLKKGGLSYLWHGEWFGSFGNPLPSWLRKRLLAEDIPVEVQQGVRKLIYRVDSGDQ